MQLLALASGACFVLVGGIVGARLLLLARRTRGVPELLLGGSLASMTFLTLPLLVLGMVLRVGPAWLQQLLYLLGLVPVVGFAIGLTGFTALVFRPRSRWAWLVVALAGVCVTAALAAMAGAKLADWHADTSTSRLWAGTVVSIFVAALAWTAVEAERYHRILCRRVSLGLADPVVADRFRLWAVGGMGAVAGSVVVVGSVIAGLEVLVHPLPVLSVAGAGSSLAVSWYLAFLPPEPYLRWVRARAPEPVQ